jgi:hypothetical protein
MTRAPSYLDDNTRIYARTCPGFGKTQAQMAIAIHVYRKPLAERILIWLLFRFGWALVLGVVFLLSGCADDLQAHADVQADLADAIHQAAKGGIHQHFSLSRCLM